VSFVLRIERQLLQSFEDIAYPGTKM
jgi:hypothetical protein